MNVYAEAIADRDEYFYRKGQEDLLNEMMENTPIDADEWLREILRTAQHKSITLKQSI